MSMSKKDFIALADALRPAVKGGYIQFEAILDIAAFCRQQNPAFKTERWLDYLHGKCGPNGGKIK